MSALLVLPQQSQAHTVTRSDCYAAAKRSGYAYNSVKWRAVYKRCAQYRSTHNYNHRCGGTVKTIKCVFGRYGDQAVRVARCESGLNTRAVGPNDEYGNPRLGLFQMGTYERGKSGNYTQNSSALVQARSGFKWFQITGWDWGAWECQP